MQCPKCNSRLTRKFYEKLPVHSCPRCQGHLLSKERFRAIKARRDKPIDDLKQEVTSAADNANAGDSLEKLRCPKCHVRMEKRSKPFGPSKFTIDRCRRCSLMWLDAGELAKLQLVFEFSQQGLERQQVRERLENMSPTEKAEFEARIASLSTHPTSGDFGDFLYSPRYHYAWDIYGIDGLLG